MNTLVSICLESLVSFSNFLPPSWCSSDIEAEHLWCRWLAITVDCDKLDVVHGVVGQLLHSVPAALGQWASIFSDMAYVAESGTCVADNNLLIPVLVRRSQLELKIILCINKSIKKYIFELMNVKPINIYIFCSI